MILPLFILSYSHINYTSDNTVQLPKCKYGKSLKYKTNTAEYKSFFMQPFFKVISSSYAMCYGNKKLNWYPLSRILRKLQLLIKNILVFSRAAAVTHIIHVVHRSPICWVLHSQLTNHL